MEKHFLCYRGLQQCFFSKIGLRKKPKVIGDKRSFVVVITPLVSFTLNNLYVFDNMADFEVQEQPQQPSPSNTYVIRPNFQHKYEFYLSVRIEVEPRTKTC